MPKPWSQCPHWFVWVHDYYHGGLSFRDISDREKLNPGTISRGVRRAREEIAKNEGLSDLMPTVRQLAQAGISRSVIEGQITKIIERKT